MRLVAVAALSLAVVGPLACVEEDGSVFIQGAVPVEAPDCSVEADSDVFAADGRLDILQPRGFTVALQVVTNLPSTFSNQDVTKSDTQAPNFPDYGSTDNNIAIFDSAEIDFEFQVGVDDVEVVEAAEIDGAAVFACDGSTCKANGQKPKVSGSVFNEQTTLSSSSIIFVEAISATDAQAFADALDGVLELPGDRVRVIADVRLSGSTTGNSEFTTFSFPFPIDLCRGCLVPNAEFCEDANATLVPAPPAILDGRRCFGPGQDEFSTAFCRCDDGTVLDGVACL